MSNQVFNMLAGNRSSTPFNMSMFRDRFDKFRHSFQGDPRQQVQQLLNSGRMSQEQFQKFSEMASQIQSMM